jgi:hypothetical protein
MVTPACSTVCGSPSPAASAAAAVIAAQLNNDDPEGQVIPSGGPSTPVLLPNVGFEIGNIEADPSTGQILILQSGLYQLTYFGAWLANGADGFVALSLLAVSGTTANLAPAAGFMLAAVATPFSQNGTTFVQLTAGERYGLIASQVSGEDRVLFVPMLNIVKV